MNRFFSATIGLAMLSLSFGAYGQGALPETLQVPVTYYDYHADHSNPEFEQPMNNAAPATATYGMVQDTLDADGKPILKLPVIANARDAFLGHWYRPWDDSLKGTKGHNLMPDYHVDALPTWADAGWPCIYANGLCLQFWNATISYNGDTADGSDTAFKNMVIHDSLPFILNHATNNYEYDNQSFFPLDGRGFGNEPDTDLSRQPIPTEARHNFSFTAEIHMSFAYKTGLNFSFVGDDDIWGFVNRHLALDLGGIHGNATGSFNLDSIATLANLLADSTYELVLFMAERQTAGSHLKIATDLIVPSGVRPDGRLTNKVRPADRNAPAFVYTLNGRKFFIPNNADGLRNLSLRPGIYVVQVDGKAGVNRRVLFVK
jgi:fibro-slime domain-containing protein